MIEVYVSCVWPVIAGHGSISSDFLLLVYPFSIIPQKSSPFLSANNPQRSPCLQKILQPFPSYPLCADSMTI